MKKTGIIILTLSGLLYGINLDSYFDDNVDVTKDVISNYKKELDNTVQKVKEAEAKVKVILKENTPPKVYFKQPRIYTIYTREELRTFKNIDMIINSGWKTIIVGNHQLIINDEYKVK